LLLGNHLAAELRRAGLRPASNSLPNATGSLVIFNWHYW